MNENTNLPLNEEEKIDVEPEVNEDIEVQKEAEYQEFMQTLADINAELLAEEEQEGLLDQNKKEDLKEASEIPSPEPIIEEPKQSEEFTKIEEPKKIKEPKKIEALKEDKKEEKPHEPTEEEKKQYKEYRLKKLFSKINYDLSSPSLTANEIKDKINGSAQYKFNCHMLLTSKLKAVKKQLKAKVDLGAVIGIGESTYLARKWEVRQAKWAKVKEIEYIIPLTAVKENKKRPLIKELNGLRKIAGSKVKFKIALDASAFNSIEFAFALECAVATKPKCIVIKNFNGEKSRYLLNVAKNCIGKCEIEVQTKLASSKEITELSEIGVDYFSIENASGLAEIIKCE